MFNNGFLVEYFDGPNFADKVHFNHLSIDGHHEQVRPSVRGVFTTSDLHSRWKVMQKEYNKAFTIFSPGITMTALLNLKCMSFIGKDWKMMNQWPNR